MTWKELKEAAEIAGVKESDDIVSIECERRDGDKTFQRAKSGNMIMLREHIDDKKSEVNGCAT